MSTSRYVHLWCDQCSVWIDEHTAGEARAEARSAGWKHLAVRNDEGRRPLDFCSEACKANYFT